MVKLGEQLVLVVPLLVLLFAYITPSHGINWNWRKRLPRRRFCENFPFAPRCLGVAAKRSPSKTAYYKRLIEKAIEETRTNLDKPLTEPFTESEHDTLTQILKTILHSKDSSYSDLTQATWDDILDDYDRPLRR